MQPVADEDEVGEKFSRVDAGACITALVALGQRRQIVSAHSWAEVHKEGFCRARPLRLRCGQTSNGAGYGSVVQVETRDVAS